MKTLDGWTVTLRSGLLRAQHKKYGDHVVNLELAGGIFEGDTRKPHKMDLPNTLACFASYLGQAAARQER